MKHQAVSPMIGGALITLILVMTTLFLPTNTVHAIPNVGLTPTPSPTPSTPTGGTDNNNDDDPAPTEFIQLQLGCTNLICDVSGQLAAMEANVELINPDTGWIAAATLSNMQSTNVEVPYNGQWDVYLIAPPYYSNGTNISATGPYPQLLGTVWTNAGNQVVSCPVGCINPGPDALPETGNTPLSTFSYWPLLALFLMCVVIITVQARYRTLKAKQPTDKLF